MSRYLKTVNFGVVSVKIVDFECQISYFRHVLRFCFMFDPSEFSVSKRIKTTILPVDKTYYFNS